ncbi:MAG: hypothetical protein ABI112_13245 [Terracoccus sp.]
MLELDEGTEHVEDELGPPVEVAMFSVRLPTLTPQLSSAGTVSMR